MGCHFLLQELFLTQRWSSSLLHWQVDSLPLSRWRSPACPDIPLLPDLQGGKVPPLQDSLELRAVICDHAHHTLQFIV